MRNDELIDLKKAEEYYEATRREDAAREHERMRRELWCKVYAMNSEVASKGYSDAEHHAGNALNAFDREFPAPI